MTAPARPATLQSAVETETEEGGRLRAWTDVATVWVTLADGGASSDAAQEMVPVRVETATAAARTHPLATAGQRLLVDGDAAPWRVLAVQADAPTRAWMRLLLDRQAD